MTKKAEFFNPNLEKPNQKPSEKNKEKKIENPNPETKTDIETEKKILESLNSKSYTTIEIDILQRTFLDYLLFRKKRVFKVKKINFAQMSAIAKIILDLPQLNFFGRSESEVVFDAIELAASDKVDKILEVLSIFLWGTEKPISEKNIKFLKQNLDALEIYNISKDVIANSGFGYFMLTTSLIQNNTQLKTAAK